MHYKVLVVAFFSFYILKLSFIALSLSLNTNLLDTAWVRKVDSLIEVTRGPMSLGRWCQKRCKRGRGWCDAAERIGGHWFGPGLDIVGIPPRVPESDERWPNQCNGR